MGRLVETMISELREDYVGAALRLPRDTMERAGAGDAVTRASDDVAEVSDALPQALPRIVVSATTLVIVGVGLGGVNVWYLAAFAVTIPVYALTARWYLRIAPPIYLAERAASSRRGAHLLGGIQALPTVHAHRLEATQLARIGAAAWESVRWAMRARIVQNRLFGRLSVAEGAGLVLVLGIGVWLALTGRATPGAVTAAALLLLRIVEPIEALLMIMDDMQSAIAALGRLVGVIGRSGPVADAPEDEADVDTPEEGGGVRPGLVVDVREVGFAYDDDAPPALRDVTLGMAAGEHVAIVGATGSGKSTLASLIAGVFEPTRGEIRRHAHAGGPPLLRHGRGQPDPRATRRHPRGDHRRAPDRRRVGRGAVPRRRPGHRDRRGRGDTLVRGRPAPGARAARARGPRPGDPRRGDG
jgi:ATP-binding cassette subfamily C protein